MTSMLISYIVMICLTGAPLLLILAFFSFVSVRSRSIERLMEYSAQICSPVVQMVALNQPMAFGSATVAPYWAMAYQVACGMLFFILAWRIIRRPARPARVELRKPIDDPYVLAQRRRRFPYYLVDPLRRKKPIENRRNPMLVKELRWGFVGRTTWLIRVFYAVLTFYMFTGTYVAIHTNGTPGETIPFILVQMIVTILAIPPLLANSLSKEYEMGNMDFLRSTLLTPYEIVVGKVCAGVFNLAPLLLASAIAGVFMIGGLSAAGLFRDAYYLVTGYGSLGACVALSLGLGMFASLATKRTSTSLMLGYGLTILVYCGIALLALFLTLWLAPDLANQQGFGTAIAFLSPVSAYVASPEVYRAANNLPWTQASPLNPYWFANVVFFTGIGLGFLVLSVVRFKYHGMKET